MRGGQFFGHPFLFFLGPFTINELEKIKADSNAIDSDEIGDVFDVIDVTIERGFLLFWADENRIDSDHTTTFADHFDLLIADIALYVVKFSRVRVRNDERLGREIDNFAKAGGINMSEVEDDAEILAFANKVAPERRQSFWGRTGRRENSTMTGGVRSGMSQADLADTCSMKFSQQVRSEERRVGK